MKFAFGHLKHERIAADVLSYERPSSGDYYDDNWLVVSVTISVGGFSGRAQATIQAAELVAFSEQLHILYNQLKGSAEFSTLEGQLALTLLGDGKGGHTAFWRAL